MITPKINTRISLKNILFLTDFSRPSEAALPFAAAMARTFGAKVYALHVLLPQAIAYSMPDLTIEALKAEEEVAKEKMRRVTVQFEGIPHRTVLVRDTGVWQTVEQVAAETQADLVVLGTHGRTGTERLLFGSVAEEIFRRSRIPVLTIGPQVSPPQNEAHFKCILYATNFTPTSLAAAPYAVCLAEENLSRLVLLNVVPGGETAAPKTTAADAMSQLQQLIPPEAEFWCRPETVVENGDAALRILEIAGEYGADLIVLGIRAADQFGAATHIAASVTHKVLTLARCPVLTVRQ